MSVRPNSYHKCYIECFFGPPFLGILDKKKGLLARRRMFLMTDSGGKGKTGVGTSSEEMGGPPHLYYVDPEKV